MKGRRGRGPAPVPFVLGFLSRAYPEARILLDHRSPFELLAATILAAQCTDARVNQVTPALFARYPGPEALAAAALPELEEAIRPTGFFRSKARTLREVARVLCELHGGSVPQDLDALTGLPGVGRKTAAVVLGGAFGKNGLPVDTHVARVAYRLGYTSSRDPAKIERDLAKAIPKRSWWKFATRLGWHGRQVCVARVPRCSRCGLEPECPKAGVTRSA